MKICATALALVLLSGGWAKLRPVLCALTLLAGLLRASIGAELTGVVQDNLGNGFSNLSVEAFIYSETNYSQVYAVTDEAGRFILSGEPGFWSVGVEPTPLYTHGYFNVPSSSITLTGQATVRLTTRKLDFTHRIAGRLLDEAGQPLAGYSLTASLRENNSSFETNVTTGSNGVFGIAAVPAICSLCCLYPVTGTNVLRLFPERTVEVAETNLETEATFTAPKATATISVTTSNLLLWDVVVSTEAFGQTYQWTQTAFGSHSPSTFPVFNGVWTVSASNAFPFRSTPGEEVAAPEPILVAVTNRNTEIALNGTVHTHRQVQFLRTASVSGASVTNATVYASADGVLLAVQPRPQLSPLPGIHELWLTEGRWRIHASTAVYPDYVGWSAEREVILESNIAPAELTFVFPEPGSGPRISGTVRGPDGSGLAGQTVWLHTIHNGTHYGIYLTTDVLGEYGTNVFPGRWEAEVATTCWLTSDVVVSNQDARMDFDLCVPVEGTQVPVTVSLLDERGAVQPDFSMRLYSGWDFLETNNTSQPTRWTLRPGLWSASVSRAYYLYGFDAYTLLPSLTWQLPAGVAEANLALVTRQATSRIEGRLRDEHGRLLTTGYASAWTSVNGTNFWVRGAINSGYFSLNVFPGEWEVGASVSGIPSVGVPGDSLGFGIRLGSDPSNRYTTPAPRFLRVSNSVAKCDFAVTNVAPPVKVVTVVTVLQETGQTVSNSVVSLYQDTIQSQQGQPNGDGNVTFLLPGGNYKVTGYSLLGISSDDTLLWPSFSLDATAPSNHIVLVVRNARLRLSGSASNTLAAGLSPYVSAATVVDGTNYLSFACTDIAGRFSLPVFPGQWTVQVDDYWLNAFGYQSLASRDVPVPPAGSPASIDFDTTPITGDFRQAQFLAPVLLPYGGLRLELRGQADLGWRIERSEDLRDWTLVGLQPAPSGTLVIEEPPTPSRKTAFYRAVWVR